MAQLSLELLSMPWGAFIRLHLPALLVSSAASLLVFLAVSAMRLRGFHPPAILGLSALLLASLLLSALYANPHYMLGEDGLWAVQSVKRYLLVRVSAFPMFEKWMKSKSSPL
jgi:protein-S-isoprenylcysteine O-methyltransferase Ste14